MRIAFLAVLLAGGIFYTYVAFTDLGFMTRTGRLGPGFFPRIIGLAIIALTIWTMAETLATQRRRAPSGTNWSEVVTIMALAVGYAVLLRILGGFAATLIYLAATLSLLNRGRHLQNATIAVLLPAAVYLLFDKLLNANMPPGLFDL